MKWIKVKFLLIAFIGILAFNALTSTKAFNEPQVNIVSQTEQKSNMKHYVISEEVILGKLKAKSQIVSMKQPIKKKDTDVDDSWLGERKTELKVKGNYKMGINTHDIKVKHIDNTSGIVYIELPDPIIISLQLPFDKIKFKKVSGVQGFLRLSMNEEEQRNFYKSVEKKIRADLMSDKEIQKQADLYSQDAVRGLLDNVGIKGIIFE